MTQDAQRNSSQISHLDGKCLMVGFLMTIFTISCSYLWYAAQGTDWMRLLYRIGGTRSAAILILIWIGLGVFLSLLWLFYRRPPWALNRETWTVILVTWLCFSVLWFYGRSSAFRFWFGFRPPPGGLYGLFPIFFFVGASVLLRTVVPLSCGLFISKKAPDAYGYNFNGAGRDWWIYALTTAMIVLVVIFFASEHPSFLRKYPWCKKAITSGTISVVTFSIYAFAALLFFYSGESFWRGYLLMGTYRQLGPISLFLMINIYVFGHFGKPLLETLGAVGAGLFLGILALKHRSFVAGAICHWVVAMSMDISALYRQGVTWTY